MKIIDLSYDIHDKMVHFKGDPLPEVKNFKSIENDGYNIKELHIGTHTSTHVDAPYHFIKNGKSVDQLDPFSYSGIVQVIDASHDYIISEEIIKNAILNKIFLYTGSNLQWEKISEFENYAYLDKKAAELIVKKNINLVGIDSPSVEDPKNNKFPVHKKLLKNNVLIIENLNSNQLKDLVNKNIFVITLPLKIKNGDGSPARVIAIKGEII